MRMKLSCDVLKQIFKFSKAGFPAKKKMHYNQTHLYEQILICMNADGSGTAYATSGYTLTKYCFQTLEYERGFNLEEMTFVLPKVDIPKDAVICEIEVEKQELIISFDNGVSYKPMSDISVSNFPTAVGMDKMFEKTENEEAFSIYFDPELLTAALKAAAEKKEFVRLYFSAGSKSPLYITTRSMPENKVLVLNYRI